MVFRPGYTSLDLGNVVFDKESECSGPRTPKLSPDQVVEENVPYKDLLFDLCFLLISFFQSVQWIIWGGSCDESVVKTKKWQVLHS